MTTGDAPSPQPGTGEPARWPLAGLAFGGDYNPEQWLRETWVEDVQLMRDAGVTFATVGVFSWALLQPTPDRFDFDWLDEVLDLLHGAGIAVDLATATASPPPWLSRSRPEILPVDRSGNRLWPGSRQAWCSSSPVFREHALALVEAMALRYRDHPALAMWHVSNELGCHNAHCYCDVSATAFRRWLRLRYGAMDRLNEAWGTQFWSQHYGDWEEILPPRQTTTGPNPTQVLDFARFSSDELLDYFRAERDLLHRLSPGVPVTTNFMVTSHFSALDYAAWAPEQDLVSQDHYLDGRLDDPVAELAFSADLTRGLARGGPWFLMEHSTSAVNWQPVNYAKPPGQLMRNSLAHVARGADAVGFFQWRASRAGAEQFHSALVPHAGTDTKVWREVVELGALLRRAADVAGTRVQADVAMLFDWQAGWACDQGNHPSDAVRYIDQPQALHRALWQAGVTADVVGPGVDLGGYSVVVVPTLYLVDDGTAEAVRVFVERGGQAVITYFSGIVDPDDHVRLGGYPGAFADLLGVRTEEFFPLQPGARLPLQVATDDWPGTDEWTGSVWSELTHLVGARAVATYGAGPLAGSPAVTRHAVGEGTAWYVGTALDDAALPALLAVVCERAGVRPPAAAPPGVEVVRRSGSGRSFLFVINHSPAPAQLSARGLDLVSGVRADGTLELPGGACAVIREEP
ncbi:MAG TPA: beta-galactosidase [Actinomycetes bacterium]